jgi:hypothetical protein
MHAFEEADGTAAETATHIPLAEGVTAQTLKKSKGKNRPGCA